MATKPVQQKQLTQQQLQSLYAAAQRFASNNATPTDIKNLKYAKDRYGYTPLNPTQTKQLDAVAAKFSAGTANDTDVKNLNTAETKFGYPVPDDQMTIHLRALGLSDDIIKGLTPDQKKMFDSIGTIIQKKYEQNNPVPPTLTTADLDKIMQDAQNDPGIADFYKEQLRQGSQLFLQSMADTTGDFSATRLQQERDMARQQQAFKEQEAAAGRAYSGFRQQAQQQLNADQSGVIQSTRRSLQRNLQSQAGAFEQTFGTGNLNSLGGAGITTPIEGVQYTPIGQVAGSMEAARLQDIRNKEQSLQQDALLNRGVT